MIIELSESVGEERKSDVSHMDLLADVLDRKHVVNALTENTFSSGVAVSVKNAKKTYGRGKSASTVLSNFNMEVKQGTIYSLLGASGCGKTTILSAMVGLKKLDSGEILVCGHPPGTRESGIPGKRVGYMPQEMALVDEFSISEILRYFGGLYGMSSEQLERNSTFLIDFLKLPTPARRIGSLSGGQQRRVSFALALIHNPELLIIDEPTAGCDIVLRQSIWEHLTNLVSTGKTTVIVTTHYTEEARGSHRIGLMRNGRLLIEDSPENLLREHNTDLLEDIVLALCLKDNSPLNEENKDFVEENNEITFNYKGRPRKIQDGNDIEKNVVGLRYRKRNPEFRDAETANKWNDFQNNILTDRFVAVSRAERFQQSLRRIAALFAKIILTFTRNLLFLLFVAFLPTIQVVLTCAAIGSDFSGLSFGVINEDVDVTKYSEFSYGHYYDYTSKGCILNDTYTGKASLHYLSLFNNKSITFRHYSTEKEAKMDTLKTKLHGYIHFPRNFTQHLKDRMLFGLNSEEETIRGSRIIFNLDLSNRQIGEEMKLLFYRSFGMLTKNLATSCNIEVIRTQTPISFNKPIYGTENTSFTEFVAPSVLLGVLFFFALLGSAVSYIKDAKSGIIARSQVAGVTKLEIMIAYSATHTILLLIQTGLAFVAMVLAFSVEIKGSVVLAVAISLLVGVAGISVGFLYTTFCKEEVQAVLVAKGTFFPNFIISGMVWPGIGMPKYLQYFALILPCTLACETIRSVISRGADFQHPAVWPGFVSTALWILLYWVLTILMSAATQT